MDLYARICDGEALGADDYVISSYEKSQLQALARVHPELPPDRAGSVASSSEYERGGTLAYMGAYDVHRAHLMGVVAPTTGIVAFRELVAKVMTAALRQRPTGCSGWWTTDLPMPGRHRWPG